MKSPVLLCFNMSPEKAAKLRLICMRFSIRFQPVPREDWGKTLSALCGLEDAAPEAATPEAFSEEMVVMALFPAGMAQQFLLALKRAQAAPGGPEGSAHPHQQPVEPGTAVYGALPGAGCPAPGQADGPHAAGAGSLKSPAKG